MSTAWRVGILVAVAAAVFAGGLVFFGGGSEQPSGQEPGGAWTPRPMEEADPALLVAEAESRGCAARSLTDDAYAVTLETEPDPPRAEGTTFRLRVTRDGEPVTGARVCLLADMTDMAHEGVSEEAREVAPGVYEAAASFVMRGAWSATVKVIEPGRPAVRTAFGVDVR